MSRAIAALLAALLVPVFAQAADWAAAETEANVLIQTRNEDGSERETTIWIVVVDGAAFIRTSSTTWGDNVERDPDVVLQIAGEEHPVRAEKLADEALIERVHAKFREKYGFSDRFSAMMRFVMGGSRIFRMDPR